MQEEVYRPAASIVLLRPAPADVEKRHGVKWQLLLLHKPRKRDAWQLPQGGKEGGEDVREAAVRELREEAGIGQVDYLGTSKDVYQYDFPASFRRFRPDNVRGQRIEFIFAMCPGTAPVTLDQNEVNKAAWVSADQLRLYIKRREYLQLVTKLVHEAIELAEKLKS